MSGAVVDIVCSDQRSRGLRAWQTRSRHATGERIGDCDLMRSTSASCARHSGQCWSGNARSMTSVKRVAGTALSGIVVLFDHHKSLRTLQTERHLWYCERWCCGEKKSHRTLTFYFRVSTCHVSQNRLCQEKSGSPPYPCCSQKMGRE